MLTLIYQMKMMNCYYNNRYYYYRNEHLDRIVLSLNLEGIFQLDQADKAIPHIHLNFHVSVEKQRIPFDPVRHGTKQMIHQNRYENLYNSQLQTLNNNTELQDIPLLYSLSLLSFHFYCYYCCYFSLFS